MIKIILNCYFCTKQCTMKALEFKTKIKNNKISIPSGMQSELNASQDNDVRVIVLIDDSELHDDLVFRKEAKSQFLKGYADSDAIYDGNR